MSLINSMVYYTQMLLKLYGIVHTNATHNLTCISIYIYPLYVTYIMSGSDCGGRTSHYQISKIPFLPSASILNFTAN